MNDQKSLTLNGLTARNSLYLLISIGMILVSVYLTNHYFELMFPKGLGSTSTLCNINDFWGCDKASQSPLGSIFGVPTSFFGIIIGLMGIFSAFISSPALEKTNKFFITINFIGCVILFIYSIAVLKGLCPFCTVYYILSGGAFFLFIKKSNYRPIPEAKALIAYALITLIPALLIANNVKTQKKQEVNLSSQYVIQFQNLKSYGEPQFQSKYFIHKGMDNAPIQLTVFSDFQCPFCQSVSNQMPELIKEFGDKISIQYFFYPLDPSCNKNMKGGFHGYACQAAYLAACDETKFSKIHDYIFAKQGDINSTNLKKWAKKFKLNESCFTNKSSIDYIQQTIAAGKQYELKSTPTIIVNGKKLEGSLPTAHFKAILRSLVK